MFLLFRQANHRKSMPAVFVGFEDDRSIKKWQEAPDLVGLGCAWIRMQFYGSSPRFLPLLIQIDKEVQSSMQHAPFVDIEVDMRVEVLTMQIFVRAPTKKCLVGNQIRDAR